LHSGSVARGEHERVAQAELEDNVRRGVEVRPVEGNAKRKEIVSLQRALRNHRPRVEAIVHAALQILELPHGRDEALVGQISEKREEKRKKNTRTNKSTHMSKQQR
jgi:hypothetical protein